jgi:hypothetical protein
MISGGGTLYVYFIKSNGKKAVNVIMINGHVMLIP